MIPVSTLYDEYIDRPKLTQQKNPFEYIVPPPSIGVGTKNVHRSSEIAEKVNRQNGNFSTFKDLSVFKRKIQQPAGQKVNFAKPPRSFRFLIVRFEFLTE